VKLEEYPLKATLDARSAMVKALAEYLGEMTFTLPRTTQPFRFGAVHRRWADFNARASLAKLPALAVLPDNPRMEAAALGPRAIEDTWGGGDPNELTDLGCRRYPIGDGSGIGPVLHEVSQLTVPLVLVVRAKTEAQRSAIVRGFEAGAFVEDGSLPSPSTLNPQIPIPPELDVKVQPTRYGRVLEVPTYFNRRARFTLDGHQILDSAVTVGENRWIAQFEVTAHMPVCVVRVARAMSTRVELLVDGAPAPRA